MFLETKQYTGPEVIRVIVGVVIVSIIMTLMVTVSVSDIGTTPTPVADFELPDERPATRAEYVVAIHLINEYPECLSDASELLTNMTNVDLLAMIEIVDEHFDETDPI